MKKIQLLFIATGLFGYFVLTGWSSGPAHSGSVLNGTPGVAATGTCSGCHAGNNSGATTISNIRLTDNATGAVVTNGQYMPGHIYTVLLNASNTRNLGFYGFQVTVRNAANRNAGTMTANQTGTAIATAEGFNVAEHITRLAAPVAGTYTPSFKWTAPVAGTGTVTMHAILNAVDGNGNVSGDAVSAPYAMALTEAAATAVPGVAGNAGPGIYPNPVGARLHLRINTAGSYDADIYNSAGQRLLQQRGIQVSKEGQEISIVAEQFPAGTYYLVLKGGTVSQVFTWIKA